MWHNSLDKSKSKWTTQHGRPLRDLRSFQTLGKTAAHKEKMPAERKWRVRHVVSQRALAHDIGGMTATSSPSHSAQIQIEPNLGHTVSAPGPARLCDVEPLGNHVPAQMAIVLSINELMAITALRLEVFGYLLAELLADPLS